MNYSAIRTVYLFGDFPIYDVVASSDDGTNLQGEDGANTPWLAGLYWPYRSTVAANPFKAQRSGGFEGMALSADGTKLLPILESPLAGVEHMLIHEFDLATKEFTGTFYRYPMAGASHKVADFAMVDERMGVVIERDENQGAAAGHKALYQMTLRESTQYVTKQRVVDLLNIKDAKGITGAAPVEGDEGVGGETFAMPFVTIESVAVLSNNQLCVVNDNNYPFSVGRHVGDPETAEDDVADDTEFILLDLPDPLVSAP
jgi:glycerophosphoryl diester phosphodiesterase